MQINLIRSKKEFKDLLELLKSLEKELIVKTDEKAAEQLFLVRNLTCKIDEELLKTEKPPVVQNLYIPTDKNFAFGRNYKAKI